MKVNITSPLRAYTDQQGVVNSEGGLTLAAPLQSGDEVHTICAISGGGETNHLAPLSTEHREPRTVPASSVPCLFCRILRGEVNAYVVWEDGISMAFLDHRPVFEGHCLLVPREHHETIADLPSRLVGPLFRNVQLLTQAVELGLGADGTLVVINNRVSQSVPHLHVHVVPRRRKDGLRGFLWPRHPYPDEEAASKVQHALRDAIARLRRARAD